MATVQRSLFPGMADTVYPDNGQSVAPAAAEQGAPRVVDPSSAKVRTLPFPYEGNERPLDTILALREPCGFCGADKGAPCIWVAASFPASWVHGVRLAGMSDGERREAEIVGWEDMLLRLLRRGPVPLPGDQAALWQQTPALDTNRRGYREAAARLRERRILEVTSRGLRLVPGSQ